MYLSSFFSLILKMVIVSSGEGQTTIDEEVRKHLGGQKDTEESGGNADDDSSDSDDEVPPLEENEAATNAKAAGSGPGAGDTGNVDLSGAGGVHLMKQSRGEKKARKTILKVCDIFFYC